MFISKTSALLDPLRQRLLSRPKGYPLVGQLPQALADPLHTIVQAALSRPGEIATVRLGPATIYLVSEPEQVQEILSDSGRRFAKGGSMWEPLRRLFGSGLVTADGEEWLRNRRVMQPIFVSRHITVLGDLVLQVVEETAARLQPYAERGAKIDLGAEMMLLTQQTLVRALFGASGLPGKAESVGAAILEAFRILSTRLFVYFLPKWVPLPGDTVLERAIRTIDEGVFWLLSERRNDPADHSDLLSLLLAARDNETQTGMTDRQLRDELVVLLVAGNETTAHTMSWLWYLLDQHPEVARRLRAELDEVLGDRAPTVADLPKLNYMKMVLQETLRLYPPGWILPRAAKEDVTLGGRSIPKGSTVLVCTYATHHDPRWWDNPEHFDPERFAPEAVARRSRYTYYPFGGGPRQCIGMQFALLEAQLITAILARRFRFRLSPGHPVAPGVATTLKPRHGMQMYISLPQPESNARVAMRG
ncbi:MAG TPA: cytochrome P450 [Polyangia bacterium]|jgi:cytochrome P450|nr:cytochrome P450 [Polyangia bacterium]